MDWRSLGLCVVLTALAGCSRPAADAPARPAAASAPAPAAVTTPSAPAAPPAGAETIDAALKAAQDYVTAATAETADVEAAPKRIRALVEKAVTAAGRGDSRGFGAAKAEVEAARKGLADGLAALRVSAATQTAAIDAASAQCVARPELANYAACLALPAQQTIVAATVEGLTSRYQAAEAAYAADRARLDEAAAAVALGGLR